MQKVLSVIGVHGPRVFVYTWKCFERQELSSIFACSVVSGRQLFTGCQMLAQTHGGGGDGGGGGGKECSVTLPQILFQKVGPQSVCFPT